MYKALIEIGGYHIGDEVPSEKAEVWKLMYKVSPVEEVGKVTDKSIVKEIKKNSILEDYLDRNQNVVKKNISTDGLSILQLKELLSIEMGDKNRKAVIKSIKSMLKSYD